MGDLTLAILLLAAGTVGAALVVTGTVLAARPSRTVERRLDRALAVQAARADQLLALLLARPGTAELQHLLSTAPAAPPPAPAAEATGGAQPAPGGPEWADWPYTPDPNELNGYADDGAHRTS